MQRGCDPGWAHDTPVRLGLPEMCWVQSLRVLDLILRSAHRLVTSAGGTLPTRQTRAEPSTSHQPHRLHTREKPSPHVSPRPASPSPRTTASVRHVARQRASWLLPPGPCTLLPEASEPPNDQQTPPVAWPLARFPAIGLSLGFLHVHSRLHILCFWFVI